MTKNIYKNLIKLSEKINYNFVNLNLIEKNANLLLNEYLKIKEIYSNVMEIIPNIFFHQELNSHDNLFVQTIDTIKNNFLADNPEILYFILNSQNIDYFNWNNIHFYCINTNSQSKEENYNYKKSFNLFIISICLNLYKYNSNDKIDRIIYWIPINKSRDFNFTTINDSTLTHSANNFEAFVASGVTWGGGGKESNPKYTIITRYEEIEKLLLHELIHNYNMDGSNYHEHNHEIINNYNKSKESGNYDYSYSIYESYTELLSSYFNMIFSNINSNLTAKKIKKKIICQIIIELLYSYNLIANLIKLNGYNSYDEFIQNKIFKGDICFYEYYYVKGLLYNNFELTLGTNLNDFTTIYNKINYIISTEQIYNDNLLKCVYDNSFSQSNYKYIITKLKIAT